MKFSSIFVFVLISFGFENAGDAHEIAAHEYFHKKYDKNKVVPELALEMRKMITRI